MTGRPCPPQARSSIGEMLGLNERSVQFYEVVKKKWARLQRKPFLSAIQSNCGNKWKPSPPTFVLRGALEMTTTGGGLLSVNRHGVVCFPSMQLYS